MSQPADDRQLGEHLVNTGKLTREELESCFEAQQEAGGANAKSLAQVMVERGHASEEEIQSTVKANSANAASRKSLPKTPSPDVDTEHLAADVRQAMADPSRRIGRYILVEEVGRGGMGVVHRGYDPRLQRDVAIKMIHETEADDEGLARFKVEARAVAKIQHPGIVTLHGMGEHQGCPFLVMDFVEGETFDALLKREKLPARRVADIVQNMALALGHAHEAGIIHRDVKPQNVMIDALGKPNVMDFGLARDSSAHQQLTQTGQIMGTPAYMAPEQADAEMGVHGPWTDVYALGAVLYRALTGHPVFTAQGQAALIKNILMDEPKPPRHIDPTINRDLETITLKCLEKATHHRYASASEVADELQRFIDGKPILARPLGRGEKAARWLRRNRGLSAALAVAVVIAVVVVAGATLALSIQATKAKREKDQLLRSAKQQQTQLLQEAEQEAVRREKAARVEVEHEAAAREEQLRQITTSDLPNKRTPETMLLIIAELDALSTQLKEHRKLSPAQDEFHKRLCMKLRDLGITGEPVEALGRYLQVELALPKAERNQLRAIPAGEALCLLGGEQATSLLIEARDGFGANGPFWGSLHALFRREGLDPELASDTARGFFKRGKNRMIEKDYAGAIEEYSRAIQRNPKEPYYWIDRGDAKSQSNDHPGALRDYSQAIELAPKKALGWHKLGMIQLKLGQIDAAITASSRATELEPDFGDAWNELGNARLRKGNLAGAIADYTRASEFLPDATYIWTNRGAARLMSGDLEGAIADNTHALKIDSKQVNAWYNRGKARLQNGDREGAIDDFSKVLQLDPENVPAWMERGKAKRSRDDLEGAIRDYSRAIDLSPDNAKAWYNRGNARKQKGDLNGALADYTKALHLNPKYAKAWVNRGRAKKSMNDIDGAIADYTRAMQADPNLAEAWINRGFARKAKSDLSGAIADWEKFLELAPNHPRASAARTAIQQASAEQAKAGAGDGK